MRGVGLLALAAAINGNALAQSVEPEGAGVPAAAPAPTQATADAPPAVPAETVPAETGVGEAGLAEIIVTATRRDTNLQTTPVAVSAVDSSLINQAAPRDIGALATFVPHFSAAKITGFTAASFPLRGVRFHNTNDYNQLPVGVFPHP